MKTSTKLMSVVMVAAGLGLASSAMAQDVPAVGTFNFTYYTTGQSEQYAYSNFSLDGKWATDPGLFALGVGMGGKTATLKPGSASFTYTFHFHTEKIEAVCKGAITYQKDGSATLMITRVSGSQFACQNNAAGSPVLTKQGEGVYEVRFPSGF